MSIDRMHLALSHPITAIVAAVIFAAFAFSGKMSINASNIMLFIAFIIGCAGMCKPDYAVQLKVAACMTLGACLALLSYWLQLAQSPQLPSQSVTPVVKQVQNIKSESEIPVKKRFTKEPLKPNPMGNLRERTILLANDIMGELYRAGWPNQMPITSKEDVDAWVRARSHMFRLLYWQKVVNTRNEFVEFHFRDHKLDDAIKIEEAMQNYNSKLSDNDRLSLEQQINPQSIEIIAVRLKVLAEQK